MRNDYYDFNPSATAWTLMLTGIVFFVVALCVLLIYFIHRSEVMSTGRPHLERRPASRPGRAGESAQPARATAPRWTTASHRHA